MKQMITKTVVKKEIKPPDPTPIPEKKPDEPKKDIPPEELFAEEEGAVGTGPFGTGPNTFGVTGGTGTGTGVDTVESVDVGDVKFINLSEVARVAKANFPEMLKRADIPVAEATVELVCSPDGKVIGVEWVSGNELVRDAVMEAVKNARFEPRPISFRVRMPFRFKLQ